jgi:transcriptional regulator with XRE-family HTH domain
VSGLEWKRFVRGVRALRGMTRRQLAEEIGVSLSTVSGWESGKSAGPRYDYRLGDTARRTSPILHAALEILQRYEGAVREDEEASRYEHETSGDAGLSKEPDERRRDEALAQELDELYVADGRLRSRIRRLEEEKRSLASRPRPLHEPG